MELHIRRTKFRSPKALYNYVDSNGLPYTFTDLYAKIVLNNPNGSKINFFGFNFSDQVKYTDIADCNWNSSGFGTSFVLVPGSSAVLIDGNFAYSQYKIALDEADQKPRSSVINGFNLGLGFNYFLGRDELKYGLEVQGFKTSFEFSNLANRKIEQAENTTEVGAFLTFKKVWERLVIEPGFRIQYYASLQHGLCPFRIQEPEAGLFEGCPVGRILRIRGPRGTLESQRRFVFTSLRCYLMVFMAEWMERCRTKKRTQFGSLLDSSVGSLGL